MAVSKVTRVSDRGHRPGGGHTTQTTWVFAGGLVGQTSIFHLAGGDWLFPGRGGQPAARPAQAAGNTRHTYPDLSKCIWAETASRHMAGADWLFPDRRMGSAHVRAAHWTNDGSTGRFGRLAAEIAKCGVAAPSGRRRLADIGRIAPVDIAIPPVGRAGRTAVAAVWLNSAWFKSWLARCMRRAINSAPRGGGVGGVSGVAIAECDEDCEGGRVRFGGRWVCPFGCVFGAVVV